MMYYILQNVLRVDLTLNVLTHKNKQTKQNETLGAVRYAYYLNHGDRYPGCIHRTKLIKPNTLNVLNYMSIRLLKLTQPVRQNLQLLEK